jgi:hypothetical protein
MTKRLKKSTTSKDIFLSWMRRIGSPTDCGYCNNMILIFRLLGIVFVMLLAWRFMDGIEIAAHDECVIKYNKMLVQLGQMTEVPAIDVRNVPKNENLSFILEEPYYELKNEAQQVPTVT